MKRKFGFYDLRISGSQSQNELSATFEKHVKFGYRTIAVDTIIQESAFHVTDSGQGKIKQSSGPRWVIPKPPQINALTKRYEDKLTVIHRLTVHFSDAEQLSRVLKEPHFSKYALLAVVPETEPAFQLACAHPKVDIISFHPKESMARVSRKHYYMAVERGICFEIMYAPAISDREFRRNIICQAHQYHTSGKSRNIVLTSGVMSAGDVRGPYDVVNLGLLFGMSEEQSKAALTYTCRKLLIDAEARRAGRAVVLVKRSKLGGHASSSEDEEGPSKRPRNDAV